MLITPDNHVPLPSSYKPEDLSAFREKAHLLYNTVKEYSDNGMDIEISENDKFDSHMLASTEDMSEIQVVRPGTITNLEAILSEYDKELMDVSRRLRHYVTNKLLEETVDDDAKVRLKSLELLGKISEVGLFSDRKEITITTRSQADINTELEKTLELYLGRKAFDVPLEAEFKEVSQIEDMQDSVEEVPLQDIEEEYESGH